VAKRVLCGRIPNYASRSKWQGKSSAGELRNIQEGTQSASLFEIPAGYTKMDIGNMMQQHSQQH
jgi:hypothetical protein